MLISISPLFDVAGMYGSREHMHAKWEGAAALGLVVLKVPAPKVMYPHHSGLVNTTNAAALH